MLRRRVDAKSGGGLDYEDGDPLSPHRSSSCAVDKTNEEKRHTQREVLCIFLSIFALSILAACMEISYTTNNDNETTAKSRAMKQDNDYSSIMTRFNHDTTSMDMIVNHCKEDISWIPTWMNTLGINNTYIYDKCGEPPIIRKDNIHVVTLPNTGREGSSWLHHMMRQDIVFSHCNIFLQGNHEAILQAVQDALVEIRLQEEQVDFVDFSRHPSRGPFVGGCFTDDGLCARYMNAKELCHFHQEYSSTENSCQDAIPTVRGEFYVSSKTMLRYVHDYRTKLTSLQKQLNTENNPILGHYLERNWGEMFGGYGRVLLLDRNVHAWPQQIFASFRRFFRFCGDTDVCHIHGSKAE